MLIAIKDDDIVFTQIYRVKQGINGVKIVAKDTENSYFTVIHEWEGDYVPELALHVMRLMQANKIEVSGVWPGKEQAYAEFLKRSE